MKIALVQNNPIVGAIDANTERILDGIQRARAAGAQLAIFSEQNILGYPARDVWLRGDFVMRNVAALQRIAAAARGIGVVVGFAEPTDRPAGRPIYNSAALVSEGRVLARARKRLLPTYDVFDESRYFEPGNAAEVVEFAGVRIGLSICEDMWTAEEMRGHPLYSVDPMKELVEAGAELLINISASPYSFYCPMPTVRTGRTEPPDADDVIGLARTKQDLRLEVLCGHARRLKRPIVLCNQVGGNDEILFDGSSCAVDAGGRLIGQAASFREDMLLVDTAEPSKTRQEVLPAAAANLHDALVMGLRDYAVKCGFRNAVLGLSGGIDSALTAALAATALGPENVLGVAMPSRFSSAHSVADARALAENAGIRFVSLPIEPAHAAFEAILREPFSGRPADVTEENVQARIRGVLLMALSNKHGSLLLTTGNKSELGVGFCTLYGDMCGGLAVISDVPKTLVYTLAHHVNQRAGRELIPRGSLQKAPSAELRPGQTDQDTLPPYDVLDAILHLYDERMCSVAEIVAQGFDETVVQDVVRRIHCSEYKRKQAAPGLKVTSRAFGFGRRMPIVARL